MVKRLKRRRGLSRFALADKEEVDAALARMKGRVSEEDLEIVRAGVEATYALRDQVASVSDAELAVWVSQMRRRLR